MAAVAATLAVVGAMALWRAYGETKARVEAEAVSSAYVVSTHIQWIVSASRQALRQIDEALGDAILTPPPTAQDTIRDIVSGLPGKVDGEVFDSGGMPVFTTDDGGAQQPVADRAFFQELKDGQRFSVSRLFVDPSSKLQMFAIARRLERNGVFAGVAAIMVPAMVMSEFWQKLALGPGSAVSVLRSDGWLVARFPPPDGPLNLADYVLFTDYLKAASHGVYDAVSPADGVTRIVGYTTVDNEPLVAIASLSTGFVFGEFWNRSFWEIGALAALMLILLFFGLWLVRVLRRDDANRLRLAAAAEQNRLLLQEVHHRVKNNLQAVSALVRLQPMPAGTIAAMENRIGAMVAIHEQAYRSEEYAEVRVPEYLQRLIDNLRAIYGTRVTIESHLADLSVSRDVALPLGLIANEVLSNAMKHAFPDGRSGTITVTLAATEPGRGALSIVDDGVGFDPAGESSGIGSRLIQGFVQQLGGEAEVSVAGGTSFVLRFPLAAGAD